MLTYVVLASNAIITIVCMGCVQALRESLENAGVKGSHCGGGFRMVNAGRNGNCIVEGVCVCFNSGGRSVNNCCREGKTDKVSQFEFLAQR